MFFLSQVLNAPLEDQQHERIGKLIDVLLPAAHLEETSATYPDALLVEGEDDIIWRVPLRTVERRESILYLLIPRTQLAVYTETEQDIRLVRDVQDKQVVNFKRKKTMRVSDIGFADDWQILGIDTSTLGLVRRLAPAWLFGQPRDQAALSKLVPWNEIELIGANNPAQGEQEVPYTTAELPRLPTGHLGELHPADIAEIVHQLSASQGAHLIERLNDETAADTMEEIDTERQLHILANLPPERASAILQRMGPDEVADLLAQLPQEQAQELLHQMNPEESEDVQELLAYKEDTAGGLMTTDYITLNQTRTVGEALAKIRDDILQRDIRIACVYCVEDETQDEQRILGVVSLWELLIANPTQRLSELMEKDVITVQVDSDPHHVAEVMAKYNLLAVPVLDERNILQGVITVDDALDVLLPQERRRKPSRRY
ncbi:MAG TPA: CBS domain-containing protein [Ktedonobacteraceae bacterium]|jgi:CBS domain-containing protein